MSMYLGKWPLPLSSCFGPLSLVVRQPLASNSGFSGNRASGVRCSVPNFKRFKKVNTIVGRSQKNELSNTQGLIESTRCVPVWEYPLGSRRCVAPAPGPIFRGIAGTVRVSCPHVPDPASAPSWKHATSELRHVRRCGSRRLCAVVGTAAEAAQGVRARARSCGRAAAPGGRGGARSASVLVRREVSIGAAAGACAVYRWRCDPARPCVDNACACSAWQFEAPHSVTLCSSGATLITTCSSVIRETVGLSVWIAMCGPEGTNLVSRHAPWISMLTALFDGCQADANRFFGQDMRGMNAPRGRTRRR